MKVKFLKPGRVAHPSDVRRAQIQAEVGDEAEVDPEWANVLVEAGRAEVLEGDPVEEAPAQKAAKPPKAKPSKESKDAPGSSVLG